MITEDEFRAAVNRVAAVTGRTVPAIRFGSFGNVFAGNGTIDADLEWLDRYLDGIEDRESAMLGVAAHELAHLYVPGAMGSMQFRMTNDRAIRAELVADEFAGDTLRKLGVPRAPFKELLGRLEKTPNHPDAADRFRAVGMGCPLGSAVAVRRLPRRASW